MLSKELIHSVVRAHHVIAVHMKSEERIDSLSDIVYVIYSLILNEEEEKTLMINKINDIKSYGLLRVKAIRTSEIDVSILDNEVKEYTIDTRDIEDYETVK